MQADLVVSAVERFAQVIPLNLQEIFIWYFEQKGVENPERFLAQGVGVNNTGITPPQLSPSGEGVLANSLQTQNEGNSLNPENQLSNLPPQNSPFDMNTLALLLGILQQVNKEKGDKAKPEDFIKVLENILEKEHNNEIQELQK